MPLLHKINKVSFEITCGKHEEQHILADAKTVFYEKLLTILDEEFSAFSKNNSLKIDKLILDLGVVSWEGISEQLKTVLSQELASQNILSSPVPSKEEELETQLTHFVFFFKNGYFHWSLQREKIESLQDLFYTHIVEGAKEVDLIKHMRGSNRQVWERFLEWTSKAEWTGSFTRAFQTVYPALQHFPKNWQQPYALLAHKKNTIPYTALLHFLELDDIQTKEACHSFLYTQLQHFLPQQIFEKKKKASQKISALATSLNLSKDELLEILKAAPNTENLPETKVTNADSSNSQQPTEGWQIGNAGAVLFHVYLPMVFKELGWLDQQKKFVNSEVQQRAILWIQYVCNGKSKQAEHELILAKLFCGWPVHAPLQLEIRFSKKEKQAALDVYESLCAHWRPLENTSIEGVRQSFIMREGILKKTAEDYTLFAEKTSIDVLLESLPFSINPIKFPWNEYLLYTEW